MVKLMSLCSPMPDPSGRAVAADFGASPLLVSRKK